MNICLVHEEYPAETNFGGIATYQKNLALGLKKLGHNIQVVCRSYKCNQNYTEDGIMVYRIYQEDTGDKLCDYQEYRKKIYQKIKEIENEIDIIESPEWGAETLYYLRDNNRKVPVVIKLHTPLLIWMENNKCDLGSQITEEMLNWEKEVIEKADSVISCTRLLKEQVIEKMEIYRNDIIVVPNPADLINFYDDCNGDRKYILYCGSLELRKGVDILAKAVSIVQNEMSDLEWVFVGKDTDRNDRGISMVQYIYDIIPEKFHNNIHFMGQIPNCELREIYSKAIILVVPSSFDNFPYVVLEGMACNVPIIGSGSSGIVEMIQNGESGIICDCKNENVIAEEIIKLLKDKKLRDKLAKNAMERIKEKYSDFIVAKKNSSIYKKTIDSFLN